MASTDVVEGQEGASFARVQIEASLDARQDSDSETEIRALNCVTGKNVGDRPGWRLR